VLRLIAIECDVSLDQVKQAVKEWAWITDALKYVELGNPERLLIVADADTEPVNEFETPGGWGLLSDVG
jgi:hypothetical protein